MLGYLDDEAEIKSKNPERRGDTGIRSLFIHFSLICASTDPQLIQSKRAKSTIVECSSTTPEKGSYDTKPWYAVPVFGADGNQDGVNMETGWSRYCYYVTAAVCFGGGK